MNLVQPLAINAEADHSKGFSKVTSDSWCNAGYGDFQGRCSVRARRLTPTPAVTTVVDEVKWQALYGAYPLQSTVYEHETVFVRVLMQPLELYLLSPARSILISSECCRLIKTGQ